MLGIYEQWRAELFARTAFSRTQRDMTIRRAGMTDWAPRITERMRLNPPVISRPYRIEIGDVLVATEKATGAERRFTVTSTGRE